MNPCCRWWVHPSLHRLLLYVCVWGKWWGVMNYPWAGSILWYYIVLSYVELMLLYPLWFVITLFNFRWTMVCKTKLISCFRTYLCICYEKCCNAAMSSQRDPGIEFRGWFGFPRGHPTELSKLSGTCVWLSEVCETMTGACGPYNLGGSATTSPQAL